MKGSPSRIIRAHYATLVDGRTDHPMLKDYGWFVAVPVVVGIVCGVVVQLKLPSSASAGLLTVSGLLSVFLFGVMLQISQRAMDWADAGQDPSAETSRHARTLLELAANSGYASLVCIFAAGVFVVAAVTSKTALIVFSAIGLTLTAHLATVLLLVMQRVYLLTDERLKIARTGSNLKHISRHRRAG